MADHIEAAIRAMRPIVTVTVQGTKAEDVRRVHRGSMAPDVLTARQVEVLRVLATGEPVKGAASRLGVSPNTIKSSLARSYQALDASCREDAYRALGWLVVP